ncbi:ogr/Delta-like zinc finger family protein [Vreelandella nanhaiensis]|uniref:ogr/Delta-like zinc finger family protein n=1 Tax=Vreelandella nanhaiensis TaxID=1258546 RepID=UPI00163CF2CB|nr:ogr/Delta-like zinc finger family protein [Halomonas nanhaiensis]
MTDTKDEELVLEGVPVTTEVSRLRFDCPHCGSFMKVRTSKTPLSEYRVLYFNCSNEFGCGFRCKGGVTLDETLAFSYCPDPGVDIKPSPWLKRKLFLEAQGQIRLINDHMKELKQ